MLWGDRALVWSEEAAELSGGGLGFVWIVCLKNVMKEEEEGGGERFGCLGWDCGVGCTGDWKVVVE